MSTQSPGRLSSSEERADGGEEEVEREKGHERREREKRRGRMRPDAFSAYYFVRNFSGSVNVVERRQGMKVLRDHYPAVSEANYEFNELTCYHLPSPSLLTLPDLGAIHP
jgi:hypothetical protein